MVAYVPVPYLSPVWEFEWAGYASYVPILGEPALPGCKYLVFCTSAPNKKIDV